MKTTKLFSTAAVLMLLGPLCAGCSTGPKNSDEANHNMSPAKMGMSHDQLMAKFSAAMAQNRANMPKANVPPGAVNAGAHVPPSANK